MARRRMGSTVATGIVLLLTVGSAAVADDKSRYGLFNPTPDAQLREMTTDRPDITESPFTVDAGRLQVETNVFAFARSHPAPDGTVSDSYEFATTNVRVGVTDRLEVNVVWQPYGVVRTRHGSPAATLRQSGIGGLDLRAKLNLWGNDTFDKTGSALALLPYVSLPTDRHNGISADHVEGGLIVPLALRLSEKLGLGLNGGVDWVRGDVIGYHAEYLASAALAYEWTDKLGTYYEVAARFNVDDPNGGEAVVLGTGLTYALADNLQFDAGVNIGVTTAADRINPFIGLSRRF